MKLERKGVSVELIALTEDPKSLDILYTVVAEFPKYLDAQVNMHKMFSKSAASSRAVPTSKVTKGKVPRWVPSIVGFNNRGMAPTEFLNEEQLEWFKAHWIELEREVSERVALINNEAKQKFGKFLEKGIINRPLDPFRTIKKVLTATVDNFGWENLWRLRSHSDAQSEFQVMSDLSNEIFKQSTPVTSNYHLPFTTEQERDKDLELAIAKSVANCAAVSYRNSVESEETIYRIVDKLNGSIPEHWGPFEHQGFSPAVTEKFVKDFGTKKSAFKTCRLDTDLKANFGGSSWNQLRKLWMGSGFELETFALYIKWANYQSKLGR